MLNRRDAMVRLGQAGFGGLTLPSLLAANERAKAHPAAPTASADSLIYLFLWGGPPQQDMWDMKPDLPEGMRSQFTPINTVVPGMQICDQMPLFARHTDKTTIIRSVTHGSNNHEPSVYHMLTGRKNPTLSVPRNQRTRKEHPNLGSVISYFTPPGSMPASVTIPRPIGHDGVTYVGTYGGFLGPRHDPLEQAAAKNAKDPVAHPTTPRPDLPQARLQARHGLLRLLEEEDRKLQAGRSGRDLDEFRERAMQMVTSGAVRRAFDLEREPAALRDRYGRNEYGECFLLARRLIEAGVKVVSICWVYITPNGVVANVWDAHGGVGALGGVNGFEMLKAAYCLPPLDRALSALLDDLHVRGMLDRTLVAAIGEFGRTPKLNPAQGREHWGACQSVLFAGGGIQGGQVYGASDKHAAYPKESPVSPEDFLATIYHALGLPPENEVPDREGRPHRIVENGQPVLGVFG